MDDDKNLVDRLADKLKSAGQAVADTASEAAKVVSENIAPKPIEAGDKLIIPSTDPSMPPVVVPARRTRRKTRARSVPAPARKGKTKRAAPRKTAKKKTAKAASKRRTTSGARSRKTATKRKAAKRRS